MILKNGSFCCTVVIRRWLKGKRVLVRVENKRTYTDVRTVRNTRAQKPRYLGVN